VQAEERGHARGRSIVDRVLTMHLVWALTGYAITVSALWWVSNRLIEDNAQATAIQWVKELDTLGTPLFASRDRSAEQRIAARVRNFSEIGYVRYYAADGAVRGGYRARDDIDWPETPAAARQAVAAVAGTDRPYVFDVATPRGFTRLLYPVVVRSIRSDGLINFKLDDRGRESAKVIGFVDLGVDMRPLRAQFWRALLFGSVVVAILVLVSMFVSRRYLRRALQSLTNLKEPLDRLASGDFDVVVELSPDPEIASIGRAINATTGALKEREQTLRRLADHDPLTGLVNRSGLLSAMERELTRLQEEGGTSAVLFADLDQFKYINDTLGHASGDRLLIKAAEMLCEHMRRDDLVGRFGGDEFVMLARGADIESATNIARTLISRAEKFAFVENGQAYNIRFSIGIALMRRDTTIVDSVVAEADMACHKAKSRGRNRFHVYEPGEADQTRMASEVSWSRLIVEALREDKFQLVYQPIASIRGEAEEFYETLVRMPLPDGTLGLPGAFLPAAERFGSLDDIDRWVIRHACAALAELRAAGRQATFAINLSGQSLDDAELPNFVRERLMAHRLPPAAVVFEVTEQVAVRYLDSARAVMRELRALGCRFALDDFGAGFSSFGYLKHLPVDFIKIDQSFVEGLARNPVDLALIRAITDIARALGKKVIAEHVSDTESVTLLRECGVDYVQGFFIAEPLSEPAAMPVPAPSPEVGAAKALSSGRAMH